MVVYADSSAVVSWLFEEAKGEDVYKLIRSATRVVCSRLTLLEINRVTQRALALSALRESAAAEIRKNLHKTVGHWDVLEITREILGRAEQRFPAEPVRSLDVIHLATALYFRTLYSDLAVLSHDERLRRNATLLGLEVSPVED